MTGVSEEGHSETGQERVVEWKPNKWAALVLGLLAPPLGMLYLAQPKLALAYFLANIGVRVSELLVFGYNRHPWQQFFSLTFFVAATGAVHAFRIASGNRSIKLRPWYSRWYGLFCAMLGPFTVLFLFSAFLFATFSVPSESMFPSIPKGSLVIVKKLGYGYYAAWGIHLIRTRASAHIERGDVIVFCDPQNPAKFLIKRVVGLPNDRIELKDGRLTINGEIITGNYAARKNGHVIRRETLGGTSYEVALAMQDAHSEFEVKVPAGHLFVLGDNRDNSLDSRHFGPLSVESLFGKVVYVHNRGGLPNL